MSETADTAQAIFREPIPFRLLIDEAVKQVRRHFRTIYLPVAVPVALLQLPLLIPQALWLDNLYFDTDPDLGALLGGMIAFGCIGTLSLVLVRLVYAVMAMAAVDAVAGRAVDMKARWRFLFRWRVLGTLLLVMLCWFGGYLLCFLPAIFVACLLAFVTPAMAEEGVLGVQALSRSSKLMGYNPRGSFLEKPMVKAFFVFFIGFVVAGVASLVVQLPLSIVEQVLYFRQAAGGIPGWLVALRVPALLFGSLVSSVVQLYVSFAMALLYFDVRQRHESRDLEVAIGDLEGRVGSPGLPQPQGGSH